MLNDELAVADPGAHHGTAPRLLQQAFWLTNREIGVALATLRLNGLPAAAGELGIAPRSGGVGSDVDGDERAAGPGECMNDHAVARRYEFQTISSDHRTQRRIRSASVSVNGARTLAIHGETWHRESWVRFGSKHDSDGDVAWK